MGKAQGSLVGLGTEKGVGVLPAMGSISLEGPLDAKCVLVPGSGRLCPLDISARCGTRPVRNKIGPRGSLNEGLERTRERTGASPFREAGTRRFLGEVCLTVGTGQPTHYLLLGMKRTAVLPF